MKTFFFTIYLSRLMAASGDHKSGHEKNNQKCLVALLNNFTLNEEFGPGTSAITRCLSDRKNAKVILNLNQFCVDDIGSNNAACGPGRAYGLFTMLTMYKDYQITNGMIPEKNFPNGGHVPFARCSTGLCERSKYPGPNQPI